MDAASAKLRIATRESRLAMRQTEMVAGAISAEPPARLDYTIQGDNLQVARVRLQSGQEVYAEADKMVYKTPNIH